jgi:hypothetical protein
MECTQDHDGKPRSGKTTRWWKDIKIDLGETGFIWCRTRNSGGIF